MKETSKIGTTLKTALYTVAVSLLIVCSVYNQAVGCNPNKAIVHCDADSMSVEAVHFIENLPADLQNKQADAIKAAIAGEHTALMDVRTSRNKKPDLPIEVDAIDLNENYRLYTSKAQVDSTRSLLIYLHGGGWCFGSNNSCATFCAELVKESGIAVLSVDYPLAPEHPYPSSLNACVEALSYAYEHASDWGVDPNRISIGGDSAGGNLALTTAIKMIYTQEQVNRTGVRANLPKIYSLVLFYPVVKVWNDGSESWEHFKNAYGLDGELMATFNMAYLNGADPQLPLISPFNASTKHLAQLPPTLLINADHDILRDQGKEMYNKMKEAGANIQRIVLPGTTHLFITVPGQPTAFKHALKSTIDFLQKKWHR